MLTRSHSERFNGGRLIALTMENSIMDANIEGIEDEFFVIVPDDEHIGYYLPYLYVILKSGYTIDDVKEEIMFVLEVHEQPVKIIQLQERPFFQF